MTFVSDSELADLRAVCSYEGEGIAEAVIAELLFLRGVYGAAVEVYEAPAARLSKAIVELGRAVKDRS